MQITPISNNYSTNKTNKQAFGAKFGEEDALGKLAEGLVKYLKSGETDVFLDEAKEAIPEIQDLKFKGKNPLINIEKLIEDKKEGVSFNVIVSCQNIPGKGTKNVSIETMNPFKKYADGKTIVKRFLNAIYDATDSIVDDIEYLKAKAGGITRAIND